LQQELGEVGREVTKLNLAKNAPARVTLQAEAPVPTERAYDRPLKVAAGAFLGGFGLLLAGVCLLDARSRRVHSADDVRPGLGLPVRATLPALPARTAQQPPAAPEALGPLTEAVDALRTTLLHAPHLDGARVLLVTSAAGGEGKTTLASHLAASLA